MIHFFMSQRKPLLTSYIISAVHTIVAFVHYIEYRQNHVQNVQ